MAKAKKHKRPSLVAAEKALAETLRKSGYTAAHARGQRSTRPDMPERFASDHAAKYPSADGFAKTPGKRELPADAKQFPVAHGHKQGYQPIFGAEWVKQLNKASTLDDLGGA